MTWLGIELRTHVRALTGNWMPNQLSHTGQGCDTFHFHIIFFMSEPKIRISRRSWELNILMIHYYSVFWLIFYICCVLPVKCGIFTHWLFLISKLFIKGPSDICLTQGFLYKVSCIFFSPFRIQRCDFHDFKHGLL